MLERHASYIGKIIKNPFMFDVTIVWYFRHPHVTPVLIGKMFCCIVVRQQDTNSDAREIGQLR